MTDKGLREIVAADTSISDIDGTQGRLWYVGYTIEDLAENGTYEEIVHLLHRLRLPTAAELNDLCAFLASARDLTPFQLSLMEKLALHASPMSMLRTSVSASSAEDPDGWDMGDEAEARKALRLIAAIPSMIAAYHRLRTANPVVAPDPSLGHAANFLHMLHGTDPDPADAKVLDTTFILYADHTMNASTFTARIIASTLSDMFSAVTGAIAALKGPLHGGANEEAMKMLEDIAAPADAEEYVRNRLAEHRKIMGFGHAVYRTIDPRAKVLKRLSRELGERKGDLRLHEIAEAVERAAFSQKGLFPNVDFYAATVYHALGIPTDLMTPLFALARMAGWTAHIREQYSDNKVIRPDSTYVGPRDQTWVPIQARI